MSCEVKIRPFPNPTEVQCDLAYVHDIHQGTLRNYAYPGSSTRIVWEHSDRRCFTGDWVECVRGNCILPNGHPRGCAP